MENTKSFTMSRVITVTFNEFPSHPRLLLISDVLLLYHTVIYCMYKSYLLYIHVIFHSFFCYIPSNVPFSYCMSMVYLSQIYRMYKWYSLCVIYSLCAYVMCFYIHLPVVYPRDIYLFTTHSWHMRPHYHHEFTIYINDSLCRPT